jgi:hypothetical protein
VAVQQVFPRLLVVAAVQRLMAVAELVQAVLAEELRAA